MGFEPSMPWMEFDAYLVSKIVKAHDFMPDLKVGPFIPVVILTYNCSVLLTKDETTF